MTPRCSHSRHTIVAYLDQLTNTMAQPYNHVHRPPASPLHLPRVLMSLRKQEVCPGNLEQRLRQAPRVIDQLQLQQFLRNFRTVIALAGHYFPSQQPRHHYRLLECVATLPRNLPRLVVDPYNLHHRRHHHCE